MAEVAATFRDSIVTIGIFTGVNGILFFIIVSFVLDRIPFDSEPKINRNGSMGFSCF